ncbi:hypothetical protein [Nocardioides massiliensis]|uniref:Membrane protein n=1 Tax=Nocardioides massiliensis TaxID=1325935 RepID=A0ABT9NRT1_9ACTN|nr:hypothetical protein [Nocardioides massiliensis]MDP9822884.1 putative membrane protein [Nocardioides massiliensis]
MEFDSAFDRTTWQVLTAVLTAVGLAVTALVWRRRGAVAGLRAFAVTLLPAAAYLTGAIRMLWEIGDAVVSFVTRLTFSPMVWTGVALLGVAVVLWVVAGFLRARGVGTRRAPRVVEEPRRSRDTAVEGRRSAKPAASQTGAAADDGMDDIDAILRRHGIE